MPNFDLSYSSKTSLTSVVLHSMAEDIYQNSVICFALS